MAASIPSGAHSPREIESREAFEQWEAALSEALMPTSVIPLGPIPFHAEATGVEYEDFGLSVLGCTPTRVDRTPRHVSRSSGTYLVLVAPRSGTTWFQQDDRIIGSEPGTVVCYDSDRPLTTWHEVPGKSLVVRVPWESIRERTGLRPDELPTITALPARGALGIVTQFFQGLADLPPETECDAIADHGVRLLSAALLAVSGRPDAAASDTLLLRQRLLAYIHQRSADPRLSATTTAQALGVSPRSLFRACEPFGGFTALVRHARIHRARNLLRQFPSRSTARIAGECGFGTERSFFRAFRATTGMTPGEYRSEPQNHHAPKGFRFSTGETSARM